MSSAGRGLLAILAAYLIWGGFPVYWRELSSINSAELLFWRLVVTALTCLALLPLRGSWGDFRKAWSDPARLRRGLLAAVMLSANWVSFLWAVNNGDILQSSLGYFLCPLFTVLLGRFVEGEYMGRARWMAIALAAAGVAVLIGLAGRIPLAALVIAASWGAYSLLKKRSQLGPLTGLGLETSLLAPVSLIALLSWSFAGPLDILSTPRPAQLLLAVSGLFTAAPLLLFAYAAPRIRLATMGMGQYIVPSCHFALALLYGEKAGPFVWFGFFLIWTGLAVYALSGQAAKSR